MAISNGIQTESEKDMYKVGVFPGKFAPPHRGHLESIIRAATQCEKLYVVVSHNEKEMVGMFAGTGFPVPSLTLRARWLSIELGNLPHVTVLMLDESDLPLYPHGVIPWVALLKKTVPEEFDVIYGGESTYETMYSEHLPHVQYKHLDKRLGTYDISATRIRNAPYKHWDYILGAARSFFTKRVLIVGVESCGKTTLTKYLAKLFYTSWAEEAGKDYSIRKMGGNDFVFMSDDFLNIAIEQRQLEDDALRRANKIVFFDTEAIVTQYYHALYLNTLDLRLETFVDPDRYDLVLFLMPDVAWVSDGFRTLEEQDERESMSEVLWKMFTDRGLGDKMVVVRGNYEERLNKALALSSALLE